MAVKLTDNQRKAVECAGRPLFIQAGAGTGKTFTLTKKLGYALSPVSGPLVPSVENILIITFTNKAAGELLGRVRAELREQGLADAALGIDGAWISTIHSMCQTLLSAHALEAHIDPCTDLLAEEQSEAWLKEAVDNLLGYSELRQFIDPLLNAYGLATTCSLIESLARLLERTPGGADGLNLPPAPAGHPEDVATVLSRKLEASLSNLIALGVEDNPSEACAKQLDNLRQVAANAAELSGQAPINWSDLVEMLEESPVPRGGNLKKIFREDFADATEAVTDAAVEAGCARVFEHLKTLLFLAQGVAERHRARKRAVGMQDTDDLLSGAFELLRDNPALAQEYARRFSLVMVDEFQDTDPLQVQIIENLCDEGLTSLTTVGDAQQSIYRFRGADLEMYRAMRARMAKAGSLEVGLDTNYRSHPDILSFVEAIFADDRFFGKEFLRIKPGPSNERTHPWAPEDSPRVTMMLAAGSQAETGRRCTPAAELRRVEAEMIAERFEKLHADGASYGDMALLMLSTKKAGPYLDAMRSRGIPCAIYGGSDFYMQPEVKDLTDLLRVLDLVDDDEALLRLLASPMFDLPDEDLLALRQATRFGHVEGSEEVRKKLTLFDALMQAKEWEHPSAAASHAADVLSRAAAQVGILPASQIVERTVWDSGWMAALQRQGAQGSAICANIRRFEDLLDSLVTTDGPSMRDAAQYFRFMCDKGAAGRGSKGKPGKMVTTGNNAVMVMTIHASKGLEFPIVAVAQYARTGGARRTEASTLTENGRTYLVIPAVTKGATGEVVRERLEALADDVSSLAEARDVISFNAYALQLARNREAEEEQRLLYVALTRARDMLLFVSSDPRYATRDSLKGGLFTDVAGVLFGEGYPKSNECIRLGTGCLVELVYKAVPWNPAAIAGDEDADETFGSEGADFDQHLLPEPIERLEICHRVPVSREILSYSALSKGAGASYLPMFITLKQRTEQTPAAKFGSAFHLVAEWMATHVGEDGLDARVAAAVSRYGLPADEALRLKEAVGQWAHSERFARALDFETVLPEHPFCIRVGSVPVEGFIDLLCLNGRGGRALIIDYKTGVSGDESDLEKRYIGQARTYAFAVLKAQPCSGVDVVFVRPEAGLQEVCFSFETDERDELEGLILG